MEVDSRMEEKQMETKRCSNCHEFKPINEFGKNAGMKDGINPYCKICARERGRKFYERNKEHVKEQRAFYYEYNKEYGKKYREEHRDELNEYFRKRYLENKVELREQHKQYRLEHLAEEKQRRNEYRAADHLRYLLTNRVQHAKNNVPVVGWRILYNELKPVYDNNVCEFCGKHFELKDKTKREDRPSIDRIVPELGYVPGNVAVLCCECNRKKNNMSLDEMKNMVKWIESKINQGQNKIGEGQFKSA